MGPATELKNKTLTFILAGGDGERLYPLTADQPKPVVPFGGVFRIIDFTLSNVLNSGLRRIYLLTQYKQERLHSYVRDGWPQLCNEFRPAHGENMMCLPPGAGKHYRGSADALFQNLDTITKSKADHVLIVSGDQVYHMDYGDLLYRHYAADADLTMAAVQSGPKQASVHMGVYVFAREALIQALRQNADVNDSRDLARDILPAVIRSGRSDVFQFGQYWRDVGTLDLYYEANLDLLLAGATMDPYDNAAWPTRTFAGPKSVQRAWLASESRVSVDATLAPCDVWMSIVSTGVRIDAGAELEAAVVMPGAHIGQGAKIRKAIVTENAVVAPHARIGYDADADRSQFPVSENGIVIVKGSDPGRQRVAWQASCLP